MVPLLRSLSNNLSVKDVYYVMKDFHLFSWLLSYDLSKISTKLVVSLIHNIIFAKFLEILLDNNVTSSHTKLTKQKSFGGHLSLYFSIFLLKTLSH